MKELFLVRHAKSDWDNPLLSDIERHLNERGYSNANLMSNRFKSNPDLLITSPAIRAASTALIFAKNLNYDPNDLLIKHELYENTIEEYLSIVKNINTKYKTVMLFAHNPTISEFADSMISNLPMELSTCSIVGIRFNVADWSSIKRKTGELILFDYPKKNG